MPNSNKPNRRRNRANNKRVPKLTGLNLRMNRLSLLGKPQTKILNASFPIYAVNSSLSTTYYSLGSSTSAATYSRNIGVTLSGTQEWVDINTLFTLYSIKSISFKISRNSNYAYTSTVISELPPVNIQIGTLAATGSTQVSYSDNMTVINFYDNKIFQQQLSMPTLSLKSSAVNDTSLFGPSVWSPLKISNVGNLPDIYFNIGFNANPVFVGSANIAVYPVATVNYSFNVVLAASTTL